MRHVIQNTNRSSTSRSGFTLVELMLSLSLIVVATALIGSLMQLYSRNFATRGDDIRRQQLARALLHMIAEDVRSVVQEQPYDPSVLEQMLGASSGGGAAAPAAGDEATSDLASASEDYGSDYGSDTGMLEDDIASELPLGIRGDQYSLMVDVSMVPRVDEYQGEQAGAFAVGLSDVPGDLKTITYYVQAATSQGVNDEMASFTLEDSTDAFASGLVRRQLDRRVTAYAEEIGDLDRLSRTGDIIAPEVVSLEFAYFDGAEWVYEWDSDELGLPWLVQILLAMQSATDSQTSELQPGVPISQMSLADRQSYGIDIYELTVAIPGAQLQTTNAGSADQAAGMDSLGL